MFGGSWGSTLALLYAQHHTDRVIGLVLRGIFTARKKEADWLYRGGAALFSPRAYDDFIAPVKASSAALGQPTVDVIAWYYARKRLVAAACVRE